MSCFFLFLFFLFLIQLVSSEGHERVQERESALRRGILLSIAFTDLAAVLFGDESAVRPGALRASSWCAPSQTD